VLSGAQTIKGYIYDAEATVKGVKLVNTTQNILSYSNDKGAFQIKAKPNDTIVIHSYFHFEKTLLINQNHFNKEIVIELKKITNQLDEVDIIKVNEKQFDSIAFSTTTAIQGRTIIKNPVFGSGSNLQPTLDILALSRVIGKLFKKKNKTPNILYITTDDLVALFETHALFNQDMLISDLNIPEDYQYLFFDYCTVNNLNKNLITKHNGMELLDLLTIYSKEFNQLLIEYKKE